MPVRTSATRLRLLEYSEQVRQDDPCKSASFLDLSVQLVPFTVVPLEAPRQKDFIAITMVAKACFRKGRQLVVVEAITQVLRRAHRRPLIAATILAAAAAVVLLRKGHLVAVAAVEARCHQIRISHHQRDSSYSQVVDRRKMTSCSPLFALIIQLYPTLT